MWKNWKLHTFLVGMQNGVPILENSLAIPQKDKHGMFMMQKFLGHICPKYMSKRNENICPHKNLYTNVHKSTVHISQKV